MKITKKIDRAIQETEVHIYSNNSNEIETIVNALNSLEKILICSYDKNIVQIRWSEILYFDSVDKKTFAYTNNDIYDVDEKLYQLEESMPKEFIRCSKSSIINLSHVKKFNSTIGPRLEAVMTNNEKIIVNRHYLQQLKLKLNGGI